MPGVPKKKRRKSAAKISSTHSKIYQASIENLKLKFNIADYIEYQLKSYKDVDDKEFLESLIKDLSSVEKRPEIEEEMLHGQLGFFMGQLRGKHATVARTDYDIRSRSYKEVDIAEGKKSFDATIVFDASFILTWPKEQGKPNESYKAYFPIDMSYASRRKIKEQYPKCFAKELDEAISEHPEYWESVMFYYFDASLQGCDLDSAAGFQGAELKTKPHPLAIDEKKFPEIDKIWQDDEFVSTMIFTPAARI